MLVDSPAMLLAENARQITMRILDINMRRLTAPLISLCYFAVKNKNGRIYRAGSDMGKSSLAI
jgi:hypothetical protein